VQEQDRKQTAVSAGSAPGPYAAFAKLERKELYRRFNVSVAANLKEMVRHTREAKLKTEEELLTRQKKLLKLLMFAKPASKRPARVAWEVIEGRVHLASSRNPQYFVADEKDDIGRAVQRTFSVMNPAQREHYWNVLLEMIALLLALHAPEKLATFGAPAPAAAAVAPAAKAVPVPVAASQPAR
jgi:hypothetical protein